MPMIIQSENILWCVGKIMTAKSVVSLCHLAKLLSDSSRINLFVVMNCCDQIDH